MRIVVARNTGFCMGVERALEAVLEREKRSGSGIVTYGPIIHNPQVVELLKSRGVRASRNPADFEGAGLGFISAHGVSPEVRERLKATRARIYDASCPDVVKAQAKIKKFAARGYSTVIFGDRGHSEVEGLLGFAEGRGHVISSAAEALDLSPMEKVCLVSQTTQNRGEFEEIIRKIGSKYRDLVVFDTICPSTSTRQDELKRVAAQVEAMVVVGGRNSANTARLARLAASLGLVVIPVESAAELDPEKLKRFRAVGVVGGASTPEWVIQEVVNRLFASCGGRFGRWFHRLLNFLAGSGIYPGLGMGALTYAAAVTLGAGARAASALAGMFLAVEYFAARRLAELGRTGGGAAERSGVPLPAALGAVSAAGVFVSLAAVGLPAWGAAAVLLPPAAILAAGRWRPLAFPAGSPLALPAVRESVKAGAIAGVASLIPAIASPPASLTMIGGVFALIFLIVFNRSTLLALTMAQKDRFMGWRTLPVTMGPKNAVITVLLLNSFVVGVILLLGGLAAPTLGLWLAPAAYVYALALQQLFQQKRIYPLPVFQVLIDGQFVIAGLAAFLFGR